MTEMKIEGLETLMLKLQQLNDRAAGRIANNALRAGAEVLRAEISRRAPRRTGKLAESITMSRVKQKEGVKYIEVGPDKDAFYGLFVEFGHHVKTKDGLKQVPAKPFMGPALAEKRSEVTEVMRRTLKAGLGL